MMAGFKIKKLRENMTEFRPNMLGEFDMRQQHITMIATLGFATGQIGQRYPLTTDEERARFGQELAGGTAEITDDTTADCGDERETIRFENGMTDPIAIEARVVAKLFGGIGLATTKALVAADALIIRDAPDIWSAYLTVSKTLLEQLRLKDAGHAHCGASGSVEASVAQAIDFEMLVPAVGLFVPDNGQNRSLLQKNVAHKYARLQNGFYGTWKSENHEDYLKERFPENFAYLKEDPNDHVTHGHNGSGMYVVTEDGKAFVKNGRAFSVNVPLMRRLAHDLGQDSEERARILCGFADDTLHVGGGIVTKDFPVFA